MDELNTKAIIKVASDEKEKEDESEWEREGDARPWSDLPMYILELILSDLYLIDCDRFHAVSKTWRSVPTPIHLTPPPFKSLVSPMAYTPWLISFKEHNSTVSFFHPIYDGSYSEIISELSGSSIRSSKEDWLLMCFTEDLYFFYNPFSEEIHRLPELPLFIDIVLKVSFSAPPSSSDCVVFGLYNENFRMTSIFFYSIQFAEQGWRVIEYGNNLPFLQSDTNPVFLNGVFYCLGEEGNVGIYDPNGNAGIGSWKVLANSQDLQPPKDIPIHHYFLMENEGDLLSVFLNGIGSEFFLFNFEFNGDDTMSWHKVENLGDRMLFLSGFSCMSAKEIVKGMGNKIYFNRFGHRKDFIFYSLHTKKYHCNRMDLYSMEEQASLSRTDLYNTNGLWECAWVEPKFETYTW